MKIILTILILSLLLSGCNVKIDKCKEFDNISTENIYKIWDETSMVTDVHSCAYRKLNEREYWDKEREKDEEEAVKILNKYLKK